MVSMGAAAATGTSDAPAMLAAALKPAALLTAALKPAALRNSRLLEGVDCSISLSSCRRPFGRHGVKIIRQPPRCFFTWCSLHLNISFRAHRRRDRPEVDAPQRPVSRNSDRCASLMVFDG